MTEKFSVEKLADSVWGRLIPRAAMILCPVLIAVVGWGISQIWESYKYDREQQRYMDKEAIAKLDRIAITLTTIDGTFRLMQSQIDNNERNMGNRFDAQGRRIEKLESKTDEIERTFRGPTYTR